MKPTSFTYPVSLAYKKSYVSVLISRKSEKSLSSSDKSVSPSISTTYPLFKDTTVRLSFPSPIEPAFRSDLRKRKINKISN